MKYAIIHVNDRSKDNMDYNKTILGVSNYIDDIQYFDGNLGNGWDVLNHWGIKLDVWQPYDGRQKPPLPGEYGIWVSTINVWKYIVENNIDRLLVIEDDVRLDADFVNNVQNYINDLPEDFDFLSLYYFEGHNWEDAEFDIGSKYIQKSLSQYSGAQAILYSRLGAKKLLKLVKMKGIEYTPDCFIFRQSLEGIVNGYSIKGKNNSLVSHDYKNIKSLIDPNNTRDTDML